MRWCAFSSVFWPWMNCKTIVEDLQDIIKFKRTISVHKSLREMIMCNKIPAGGATDWTVSKGWVCLSLSLSLSLSQLGQCDITRTWCTTVSYHSQQWPLTDRGQNDPNTHTKTAFRNAHSGDGDLLASVSSGSSGGSSTSSPLLSSSTNGSCDGMTGSCREKTDDTGKVFFKCLFSFSSLRLQIRISLIPTWKLLLLLYEIKRCINIFIIIYQNLITFSTS